MAPIDNSEIHRHATADAVSVNTHLFTTRSPREPSGLFSVLRKNGSALPAVVHNISTTGMLVDVKGLRVGERVAVVPRLDGLKDLKLTAEVVRLDPHGVALRLLGEIAACAPGTPLHAPLWMRRVGVPRAANDLAELIVANDEKFLRETPVRAVSASPAPGDVTARTMTLPAQSTPQDTRPRFVIRPTNIDKLRHFFEWDLAAGGTMLFTQNLCLPGTRIVFQVAHPQSVNLFELDAVVVHAHRDRPRRMDLVFEGIDVGQRQRFADFVMLAPKACAAANVNISHRMEAKPTVNAARAHDAPIDGGTIFVDPTLGFLEAEAAPPTPPPMPRPDVTIAVARPNVDERADTIAALRRENEALKARVADLSESLAEAENAERSLIQLLHSIEAARRGK